MPQDARDEARIVIEAEQGTVAEGRLAQALRELAEFCAGRRREFTVALDPAGAPFYQEIWAEVARVPYGRTRSYGEIAPKVATPEARPGRRSRQRANPVAPFVPSIASSAATASSPLVRARPAAQAAAPA